MSPIGMVSIRQRSCPSAPHQASMSPSSFSFSPRSATALIFTCSPAAFAAAIPSRTPSSLPQRVIRLNRAGSSVSMLTLMRRTPASASPRACLASCVPFVVSVSSSSPSPIRAPSRRTSVITSRRTSGSPPVSRSLRTPCRMNAVHSASSSSRLSTSRFGRKVMSSAMQYTQRRSQRSVTLTRR